MRHSRNKGCRILISKMREIREIIEEVDSLPDGDSAVLATVVELRGSGYRLPGARMLISSDGRAFGTVSGGCLEADVLERAKGVIANGRPEVFVYDTTANEDSVFSLNMGCRGVIRILLEPVTAESPMIKALRRVSRQRQRLEMATLIGADDSVKALIGERIIVCEGTADTVAGKDLLDIIPQLHDDLLTFAGASARFQTIRYESEKGETEFSFETLHPPVKLLILGAGADAVPLAEIAHDIGWDVEVTDHRPAFLTPIRFPFARLSMIEPDEANSPAAADPLTAIVSMNHNFDRDKTMITAALRTDAFYIGALGPKQRTREIVDQAKDAIPKEALDRLRSPAGLDIGGDSPETIAVSIVAEIQSVLKHRSGSPLRDREAPIYDR